MVAIFGGAGAGLERGSANILGPMGQMGDAAVGRGGESVAVNARSGNLVISRQDEFLTGLGPDAAISRTYNSLLDAGGTDRDNGDGWQQSTTRQVFGLQGAINSAGSSIKRLGVDGTVSIYTYETRGGETAYWNADGSGAHDKIVRSGVQWIWTDGDSQSTEKYVASPVTPGVSRLFQVADISNNIMTFHYVSGSDKIASVETKNGEFIEYTWSNNNITHITTRYIDIHDEDGDGNTTETFSISRVSYGYDSSNRLISVTTDLTPENSSDSEIYTTTYTYSGSTNRVATISQTDGSQVSITYFSGGKVQFVDLTSSAGVTRRTSFAYSADYTTVNHADGSSNNHYFDSQDRLTQINYQAEAGGPITTELFAYDSDGNVLSVTNRAGEVVTYEYDVFGNTTKITDGNGNVTDREYDADNNLIRQIWTGSDGGASNVVRYSHYAYDSNGRLGYAISPDGEVTEYSYQNSTGLLRYTFRYPEHPYSVSASTPSFTAMEAWRDGLVDKSSRKVSRNLYDARGNLVEVRKFGMATTVGGATTSEGLSITHFEYDQTGQLLSSRVDGDNAETLVYDGLGRMVGSVDGANNTISIVFDDAASKTIITNAAGYISTETYNLAGELISRSDNTTAAGATTTDSETASYQYDNMGRLRIMTDQRGIRTFYLYDRNGNQTGVINEHGQLQEFKYDPEGRLIASIQYTNYSEAFEATLANPDNTLTVADVRPVLDSKDISSWTIYDNGGRVAQTIDGVGAVSSFEYDKADNLVRATHYKTKVDVTSFKVTPPSSPVSVTTDASQDVVIRSFYDLSSRQIGSLDGEGYLTEIVYDSAGQLVRETAYTGLTAQADRASGTFAQLKSSAGSSGRSVHSVYDGQGLLRYQVDDLGYVTGFQYDEGQRVTQTRAYHSPISTSDYTYDAVKAAAGTHADDRITSTVYDSAGRTASVTDPAGLITTYTYDVHNNVASVTQDDNGATRKAYNFYSSNGRLKYTVDPEGYVVRFDYTKSGDVTRERVYDSAITVNASTTIGDVNVAVASADTSQAFADTVYGYNNIGERFQTTNAEGEQTRRYFWHGGAIKQSIQSLNTSDETRTYYDIDAAGRNWRTRSAYAEGSDPGTQKNGADGEEIWTYSFFNAFGRPDNVRDGEGNQTALVYDRRGLLIKNVDAYGTPGAQVTDYKYNAFGEVVKVTDPRGNSTYTYYDDLGRVTLVAEAAYEDGGDTHYYVTQTTYTAFGEVAQVKRYHNTVTGPLSLTTQPVVVPDAGDAVTTFVYDEAGRLSQTIDAEGYSESYTYNRFGERISKTGKSETQNNADGADNATTYTYDKRGLLISETLPIQAFNKGGAAQGLITNSYSYDSRGNRTSMTEAVGLAEARTTTYVYDKANRLVSTIGQARIHYDQSDHSLVADWASSPPSETLTYDERGNITSTVDASGARTVFFYDDLNRKVVEIDAVGTYTAYEYDANSNVTRIRIFETQVSVPSDGGSQEEAPNAPSGAARETLFEYDALNRMTKSSVVLPTNYATGELGGTAGSPSWSQQSPAALDTFYEYDANGNVLKTTDPNGNETFAYYDKLGRKTHQVAGHPQTGTGGYLTAWEYDSEGNVTRETVYANAVTSDVSTSAPPSIVGDSGNDRVTLYTYDEVGNRLTETRLNIKVHNSSNNGTTSTVNGTVSYSYNGLGQVMRKTEATGDFVEYTYDDGGRLTNERKKAFVGHTGSNIAPEVDYFYDGLANLTRSIAIAKGGAPARATRYEYNEGGLLRKVTDPNDNVRLYYYDISGRQIIERYTRTESDGTAHSEAQLTKYDLLGRVTEQKVARRVGSEWLTNTASYTTTPPPSPPPSISVSNASATEGDAVTFIVSLSGPSDLPISVNYATAHGTAGVGDYTSDSGLLSFAANETTKTITIQTASDAISEGPEDFFLNLSNASGATIADGSGTATILDATGVPTISVSDASASEGSPLAFTITLSHAASSAVSVDYSTATGSAGTADYQSSLAGTVTFNPDQVSKTITVGSSNDSLFEPNEQFTFNLANPSGATILDGSGTGTIIEQSAAPMLSVNDVSVSEGDTTVFTISLSTASSSNVSVNYATAHGSAGGADYFATSGSVIFSPGQTQKSVSVSTKNDSISEGPEAFALNLSNASGAGVSDGSGTATINDGTPLPSFSVNNASADEGQTATFTVSLSGPSSSTQTVNYVTNTGSAGTADYQSKSGTLTFDPGQTSRTVTVQTNSDSVTENPEKFYLDLSNPSSGATISGGRGDGTIYNVPLISVSDASIGEGGALSFNISLDTQGIDPVTLNYSTSNGSATAGADYTATSGSITFEPLSLEGLTRTVLVQTNSDSVLNEGNETVFLNISNVVGATVADGQGKGTIQDTTVPPPLVSIFDSSVNEGGLMVFTVRMDRPATEEVTATFETEDITAVAGSDYPTQGLIAEFEIGETETTVEIQTYNDENPELDETFKVKGTGVSGGGASFDANQFSAVGTIIDDDPDLPDGVGDPFPGGGPGGESFSSPGGLSGGLGGFSLAGPLSGLFDIPVTTPSSPAPMAASQSAPSDTNQIITSIQYNAFGDVVRTSTNGRWETENKYDLAGRMWASNAGDGIWKFFGYDKNGNQTLAVTSAGAEFTSATTFQSALGDIGQTDVNATYTAYDARNMAVEVHEEQRQLSATTTQNLLTERTYNAFGEVASETDARGATLNYTYNTMGRLIRSESPTVSVTNEDGSTQWVKPAEDFYYDKSGRLVAQRDANGTYSGSGSAGNGVTKTANTGNLTRFELLTGTGYGGTEALITRQINADGGITRTSFDVHGDARKIEVLVSGDGEPGGQTDTWRTTNQEFDKLGRLTKLTQPNGLEINYIYDELGQRIGEWNSVQGSNNKQTTDYNKHGQVIATRAYGGDFTTISYDFDWFLEASGSGMTDVGGWVKATTFANDRTLTETSDIYGRAIFKNDLGGNVTTYSYDKAGRQITSAMGGSTATYTYLNTGQIGANANLNGVATYAYDAAGNRTAEKLVKSGVTIKDQTANYDLLGRMTQWDEAGTTTLHEASKDHEYDAVGNIRRTQEFSIGLDKEGLPLGGGNGLNYDFWFRYDSMNRVVTDKGELSGTAGAAGTTIERGINLFGDTNYGRDVLYDKAGQRVAVITTFVDENNTLVIDGPGGTGPGDTTPPDTTQDPIGDPGAGNPGGGGTWVDGQGYRTEQRESYTYNSAGQLTEIRQSEGAQQLELPNGSGGYDFPSSPPPSAPIGGDLRSRFTYDLLGRQILEEGFLAGSPNAFHSVATHFNAKGQVIETRTSTWKEDGDTRLSITRNDFGAGSNYALGQVVQSVTDTQLNGNDSDIPDTALKYTFRWYDSAVQDTVQHDKDYSNNDNSGTYGMTQGSPLSGFDADYTTTHTYNAFGQLTKADVDDGLAHDVNFTLDELGQIILREETKPTNAHSSQLGSPHEMWYRFNGREMGYLSNNGTTEVAASTALDEISRAPSSNAGTFRGGSTYGSPYHDLNNSYDPLNAYYQGSRAGTYTVRGGESLQAIAASVYGDSNLWYKIAEANGLSAGGSLAAGQILRLPAGVVRTTHNADTFKPYDPGQAIGELSPTTPKPKKGNNCGAFGQILLSVVAVAVAIVLPKTIPAIAGLGPLGAGAVSGAAGSAVSQGFGVATGIQDKFDWKGVGQAAIGGAVGGITGGLDATSGSFEDIAKAAVRGAAASAVTQGIATVTGLQDSFSFAGVAAAGIAAGVGHGLGHRFGLKSLSSAGGRSLGNIAAHTAVGAARLFASAATRSAITGSNFGDAVEAGLPDVIGQVVGQVIGGAVVGDSDAVSSQQSPEQVVDEIGAGSPALNATLERLRGFALNPAFDVFNATGEDLANAVEISSRVDALRASGLSSEQALLEVRHSEIQAVLRESLSSSGATPRGSAFVAESTGHIPGGAATGFGDEADFFIQHIDGDLNGHLTQSGYNLNAQDYAKRLIASGNLTQLSLIRTRVDQLAAVSTNDPIWGEVSAELHRHNDLVRGIQNTEAAKIFAVPAIGVAGGATLAAAPAAISYGVHLGRGALAKAPLIYEGGLIFGEAATGASIGVSTVGVAAVAGSRALPQVADTSFIGPLIGRSGFRTSGEFADAVGSRYQAFYNDASKAALRSEAAGALRGLKATRVGAEADRLSAARLQAFLRAEGISEGPGGLVQINRWLRDPSGSGKFVRPDVRIPAAGRIFDGTVGTKTYGSAQITGFRDYSGGDRITIIRPESLGSYSFIP